MIRAAAFALLALPATAAAEQLSLTWEPRTAEEADLLAAGLLLWSLGRELGRDGSIEQWGRDNTALLLQDGHGNWGAIRQRGRGHAARLEQDGGGNGHAIVQTGRGARADVEQDGGEFGLTLQHGW